MKRLIHTTALLTACTLAGCAVDEQPTAEGEEIGDAELGEAESYVFSCAPGYHPHTIDWSATRIDPLASCGNPGGPLLHYGQAFCMASGSYGTSCGGDWWVLGYAPSWGTAFEYVKIRALDGH